MRLDSVIEHAKLRWLVTEQEKVAWVRKLTPSFSAERLPHVVAGKAPRRRLWLLHDDVLIGLDESHEPTFVYVVTNPVEEDWRRVVARYGDLFAALPRWTFRACFPPEFSAGMGRFHILFREELAEPLSPGTLDDLRWHFEQLRSRAGRRTQREDERFQQGQVSMLVSARFRLLYERWLADGEAAFEVASSHAVVEQLGNQTGSINCVRLPVSYRHLSPLVSHNRTAATGVESGVEQGDGERDETSARAQPPSGDCDLSNSAECARDWQRLVDAQKQLMAQ
jgi:hypothetical protein